MIDFNDVRFNVTFVTLNFKLDTGSNPLEALQAKYSTLHTTLTEADNSIIFLPIDTAKEA